MARYDPHVEWYESFRPSLHEDEADALRRMLGRGHGRCLDIGCGTGVAIPELTRLGWTVVGVDGLRARVGATHLPLGLFIQTFLDAGFQIESFEELGAREYPYSVALGCRRSA